MSVFSFDNTIFITSRNDVLIRESVAIVLTAKLPQCHSQKVAIVLNFIFWCVLVRTYHAKAHADPLLSAAVSLKY